MSSISKFTVSLSLLTLLPLHAMEEDSSYGKKGKQITNNNKYDEESSSSSDDNMRSYDQYTDKDKHEQKIKDTYITLGNDENMRKEIKIYFFKEGSIAILKQTIHALKNGNIDRFGFPNEPRSKHLNNIRVKDIETEKDGINMVANEVEDYFEKKHKRSRRKIGNAAKRLPEIQENGKMVCQGKYSCSLDNRVSDNDFSRYFIENNKKRFMTSKLYATYVGKKEIKSYFINLVSAIQHKVASECFEIFDKQINQSNHNAEKYKSAADEYEKKARAERIISEERLAELQKQSALTQKYKTQRNISIPACLFIGGTGATGVLYYKGYINMDKVTEDAGNLVESVKTFTGLNS